jgi:hypothetical protein
MQVVLSADIHRSDYFWTLMAGPDPAIQSNLHWITGSRRFAPAR